MSNLIKFNESLLNNGGASFSFTTEELNPKIGFSVSLVGYEVKIPLKEFSPKNVLAFIGDNYDILHKDNMFLGGWVENGVVYLDISELIGDKETAIYQGIKRNQLAIFDNSNEVVINLPKGQGQGTLTQIDSYAKMKARELSK